MASYETLDYTIMINGHTVTCFEVGSVPTIGYASIEDAMTDTNPVTVPEVVFDAACALLDQGIRLTTIYVHMDEDGYAYMNWDEIPEELTAEDIALIEGEKSVHKSDKLSRKIRRAVRIERNKQKRGADRAHGKRRPVSRKDFRHAERQELRKVGSNAHIPYLWTEDLKGSYIPVRVKRERKIARTYSVRTHKDTIPVLEQKMWYAGIYETREISVGVTVTMEWNNPEAIQEEPV